MWNANVSQINVCSTILTCQIIGKKNTSTIHYEVSTLPVAAHTETYMPKQKLLDHV